MSKAPIILIGGAAVVGIAVLASKKASSTTASPAVTPGKTAKSMTDAQKDKLAKWAKEKGVPVEQAWDLAKSVYGGLKL